METDIATRLLAGVNEPLPHGMTWARVDQAADAVAQACGYGRNWHWDEAYTALRRAYGLLGAEYPAQNASGYDWHLGRHPVQVAAGHRHIFSPVPRYGTFPAVVRCECGVLAMEGRDGEGGYIAPPPDVAEVYR